MLPRIQPFLNLRQPHNQILILLLRLLFLVLPKEQHIPFNLFIDALDLGALFLIAHLRAEDLVSTGHLIYDVAV